MQLLLNIDDKNKAALLLEFLKSLNYVNGVKQVDDSQTFDIPEWHKPILDKRLKEHYATNDVSVTTRKH
ncbi:MAG: hypothetical protein WC868_12800 [Bacteroidales bacterium]